MLYNWAAANPDRVACIGAIFPVCDLGALDDLELVGSAYGMDANSFLEDLHEYNPIDHLAPLVDAGVPILHVHGERDELIPLDLHTGELARRYRRLGGEIRVITIPGVGHEVHPAFFRCQALVEFLIRHSIPM
jgi:pimeloyl-ACP methyl ester carboxylesterase